MKNNNFFKIKIDEKTELKFDVSNKAFFPTGTSEFLLKSVCSRITSPGSILDLGCGIGVVGISLAKLGKTTTPIYLSDASKEAIKLTKKNAMSHSVNIDSRFGSLYEPWSNMQFDYIINDVSGISEEIAKISPWFKMYHESGYDGVELVTKVLEEAPRYLKKR